MTEEIIIDGVNVAGCKDYDDGTCCNDDVLTLSCEKANCMYKQLKRLEQKNKQMKSALEEIRDYLYTLTTVDNDFPNTETYLRINDKIEEVLK